MTRAIRGPLRLTLVALAAVLIGAPSAAASVSSVTVYGSTVTVRPDQALPPNGVPAAAGPSLRAARNEFESFQLAIMADAGGANLTVAPGADLTRQGGGGTIPISGAGSRMTIYREAFYDVNDPPGRSDQEGGLGLWPDALIPEVDPIFGEDRNAFPHAIGANGTAVAWIDIFVPAGQADGIYTGTVLVQNGAQTVTVPVTLEVMQVDLPSTSSLQNLFPTRFNDACLAHTGHALCNNDLDLRWRLQALYARVGLENRVTISNPVPTGYDESPNSPTHRPKFEQYILPLINGSGDGAGTLPRRLSGAELTLLHAYWQCLEAAGCLAAWKEMAEEDGFASKFMLYACDEPPGFTCTFAQAATRAASAHATWPGLPRIVTTTIQQAQANGVDDDTDVLAPNMGRLDGWDCCGFPYIGNQRAQYDTFLNNNPAGTAPNQAWVYSSDSQHGSDWNSNGLVWEGWPGYVIDAPAAQARAMSWLVFEYRLSGELYYQTTEKLPTAWNVANADGQGLAFSGGHGDGTLFYPGTTAQIGGATPIPIESIRLKRIREGREDYELLRLAEQSDGFAAANAVTEGVFGPARTLAQQQAAGTMESAMHNVTDAKVTQADFDAARVQLFQMIDPPAGPMCLGLAATITGNGNVTGTGGADVIVGGPGDDTISGLGGNDRICGEGGFDTIQGGGGDDQLEGGAGGDGVEYGPAGAGVDINLANEVAQGAATGTDTLTSFTEAYGSGFADTLVGRDDNGATLEFLAGNDGPDQLAGNGGTDRLDGGAGNDILTGGAGVDTLNGQADDDSLFSRDSIAETVNCGTENDSVEADLSDTVAECESVLLPSVDSDGDGVSDDIDGCPLTPGPLANGGCPVSQPPVSLIPVMPTLPTATAPPKRCKKGFVLKRGKCVKKKKRR